MTSPNTSASTSTFSLSGNSNLDPLLNDSYQKWGGGLGTGGDLSFSFPWSSGSAFWQSNYSSNNEQNATYHFGFNSAQMVAARSALQQWANVANVNFNEVADTQTDVGDFRFAFSSALGAGTWGVSFYPNNYWASAADVWVNSDYGSDTNWSAGSYNYESLTHEIGHGLGLKHPGNYNGTGAGSPPFLPASLDIRNYSIMSYNDPVSDYYWDSNKSASVKINRETPMVYDIQAIQYLYGVNTSYHAGNDTYTFDPAVPFYKTIWDAGGTDTIDCSNFSLGCTIDIIPGNYSKISFLGGVTFTNGTTSFDGTNDLGIAFGTVIENVIGGNGNDTLIGNNANNTLQGSAGNDTINGGAGNDTAAYSLSRANYVITATLTGYTIFSAADGTDTLSYVEYASFSDQTVTLNLSVASDTTAPAVTSFSPADEAISVAIASNIVLTFSEAIAKGTGSIILKTIAGVLIATYDAASSTNLSISGSTLTLNPTADLSYSTGYTVEFAAGSIKDLAGNSYVGTTSYNFTTIPSATPADYAGNTTSAARAVTLSSSTQIYSDWVGTADPTDFYSFTLPVVSNFSLSLTGLTADADVRLYGSDGVTVVASSLYTGTVTESISQSSLAAGTYYVKVNQFSGDTTYALAMSTTAAPSSSLTKAKVFMGVNDSFTVSDSGATMIGNLGVNIVKITSGVTGVKTDANFSRIELGGNLADYKLGVVPGTGLQIQTAAGTPVDTLTSLNTDVTLAFANGSAILTQTGITAFTLGGLAISTTAAGYLPVTLNAADVSSFGTATSRATTHAKVFMGANDSFTVSDSGATMIGNLGINTVKIASGVTGVKTDANFSRIELGGNLADYKLGVVPGTGLQIQTAAGTPVDTLTSLNTDVTLAFADGSAILTQTGITAFTLGGLAISTTTAGYLPVTLNAADRSSFGAAGGSAVNVSAAGTTDASSGNLTFNVHPTTTFTYNVTGFTAGDNLLFDAGSAIAISNASATDGIVDVSGTLVGQTVTIHLTGVAVAQDTAFNVASFNTAFGAHQTHLSSGR